MFGCLISGLPVNTDCKQIQVERFVFDNLQFNPKINSQHLALFTLSPGFWTSPSAIGFSATIYLQFHADVRQEWKYLGSIGAGKESAFFKIRIPEGLTNKVTSDLEVLAASLGISIVPTVNLPVTPDETKSLVLANMNMNSSSPCSSFTPTDSLIVAKKLLDNFVNYALSYSQTFLETGNEAFIPAKIITDWYGNTVRKAQLDPIAFFNRLLKSDD